jgi:DNA ligase-associated metallophosphoesterase
VKSTVPKRTRSAPSPLVGEGGGGGYDQSSEPAVHPPPCPSPTRGEGTLEALPVDNLATDSLGKAEAAEVPVAGVALVIDPAGALYWPEQGVLVVSDLHLEKGSSFARRGMLLPPYDTAATLARLVGLIARYAPRLVIALGDSFHDGDGPARLVPSDRAALAALQRGRDWLWIAGNHDPDPVDGMGGRCAGVLALGPLVFRHEPSAEAPDGEIAGHLHPVARLSLRGRAISRRCFVSDGRRMVMPAFGAYAGGLSVRDHAFAGLFDRGTLVAHLLGERRLYAIVARRWLPD